ncbi:Ribosome-binding protein 1 [Babesia ovata]|uniref:Ribosome-binding protein 1 n=1 Tax=Babesia ovata TaxID=189622 RepID=A0A2H6K9U2_9APIC|nr:Ribosome-binding protein 1 [Babesia ovata]GBE59774.1 Ribosome-binding protein 1 [Babesia ovata]
MAGHGVKLDTLKDCLMFLEWLNDKKGMQGLVAKELCDRIKQYYQKEATTLAVDVEKGLSPFLNKASTFYNKLATNAVAGNHDGKSAKEVTDALLECLPKFLAAIYFLQYCINNTFKELGGGGWQYDWLGYDGEQWDWSRFKYVSGGDLAKYLYARTDDQKYSQIPGLIPGGFGKDEVKQGSLGSGYPQGTQMYVDLEAIVKKNPYNFFRSVFVSSAIGESANRNESTANALSLVRTFCDIVLGEKDKEGGKLIAALNADLKSHVYSSGKSICWKDLRAHCDMLRKQFDRFLVHKSFDFTGQSTDTKHLNKEELAKKTADWFRTNLILVRGKLNDIKSYEASSKDLGAYFTKNLFPYGFTFHGQTRFGISETDANSLAKDLYTVINELQRSGGDLERLVEILNGEGKTCKEPEPPPKKPEVPPAKDHEGTPNQGKKAEGAQNQGKKSEGAQNQGKKSEGAQNQGKKAEGAQNQGKKAEGAQNQGKKSEGAQNQGKKVEGTSDQDTGQGRDVSSGSASGDSAKTPSPGAPGPPGSTGDEGQQGITGPVTPASTPVPGSPVQTHDQTSPKGLPGMSVPPPPPPPPPLPGGPGIPESTSQPGGTGQGSKGGDASGQQPGASQGNVLTQPTSASGPSSVSAGGRGAVSAGSGGAGQQGNRDVTQPTSQSTDHDSSGDANTSDAPASGGGTQSPKCAKDFTPVTLWQGSGTYCVRDAKSPVQNYYKDNDTTSQQLWEDYKQREILPLIEEKIKARRREKEEEERKRENERQLKYQSMLPEIGVLYKPRESSQNLEEAYRTAVQNKMKDAAPNVSLEITRRTGAYANNHDDGVTADVDEPLAFDIAKPDPLDLSKYVVLDIVKPDLLEEKKPVASDLYKSVALGVKGRSEADGFDNPAVAILDGQDALEDHVPVLQNPQEAEKQEMLAQQGNALTGTTTDNYQGISAFKPRPGAHPIGTFSGNALYKLDTPNAMPLNVEFTGQATPNAQGIQNSTPSGFFAAIGIPKGRPLKPANYVRALPPVSDITGKSIPDRDLNARLLPPSPIGKHPVPIMQPGKREQDVDRYQPAVIRRDLIRPKFPTIVEYIDDHPGLMIDPGICPASYGNSVLPVGRMVPPTDYFSPSPKTVREMLCWLSDLPGAPGYAALTQHIAGFFDRSKIIAPPASFSDNDFMVTLSDTCCHASAVLTGIHGSKPPDLSQFHYERYDVPLMHYSEDPCTMLCQLLSYVYAACHQLSFLRTQCSRDTHSGGWRDCKFGRDVKVSKSWKCSKSPVDPTKLKGHGCDASPLQGFLTDQSVLSTYWYQRGNICRRSRVKMGFLPHDLREESKHGFYIYQILKGLCYNADQLEKLCTYLNCLTRRTPRTTGELVSFFHNFGNSLHKPPSELSMLGSALSAPHENCPKWDSLAADDLRVIKDAPGYAPSSSNHQDHPDTLSTLLGCGINNLKCSQLMKPITYRAYTLYSSSFVHHYLSWAVYLPDRLWESLDRLSRDMKKHDSVKCASLHNCADALPLLYSHGFTPPDGTPQSPLTCSEVIVKLEEVVSGKPIARLMTAMDNFLYRVREPFFYTLLTLWSAAFLVLAHTLLYRIDVLRIRSHLLTTRASHLIDVKALLAGSRRMLSLYHGVDYFDDDPMGQHDIR